MNYYILTFSDGNEYTVRHIEDLAGLIKFIIRNVSTCTFGSTVYLERPIKIEKLAEIPQKAFDQWW
jgi:hypothetical protein